MVVVFCSVEHIERDSFDMLDFNSKADCLKALRTIHHECDRQMACYDFNAKRSVDWCYDLSQFVEDYNDELLDGGKWCFELKALNQEDITEFIHNTYTRKLRCNDLVYDVAHMAWGKIKMIDGDYFTKDTQDETLVEIFCGETSIITHAKDVYVCVPDKAYKGELVCIEHKYTKDDYPYYCPILNENVFETEIEDKPANSVAQMTGSYIADFVEVVDNIPYPTKCLGAYTLVGYDYNDNEVYISTEFKTEEECRTFAQTTPFADNVHKIYMRRDLFCVDDYSFDGGYIELGLVKTFGTLRYRWKAQSEDLAFEDCSRTSFATKKEAYEDMRDHALSKMKWNTQFNEDFQDLGAEDYIGYQVRFTQNKIIHESFSGVYTYEIYESYE